MCPNMKCQIRNFVMKKSGGEGGPGGCRVVGVNSTPAILQIWANTSNFFDIVKNCI